MKVLLQSAWPMTRTTEWNLCCLRGLQESFANSSGEHALVTNGSEADIILFFDPGPLPLGLSLLGHPSFRRWPQKCFVYDEHDFPSDWYRGLIVCLPKERCDPALHRGAAYVRLGIAAWTRNLEFPEREIYLFSFCGASETHPVRARLKELFGHLGCIFETPRSVTQTAGVTGDSVTIDKLHAHMEEICRDSLFILCPRGRGTSSMRLFESMSMGRAPVVISDSWVPPYGADWNEFAIQVREDQIDQIPQILEERRPLARQMGCAARRAWERWYSPERHFTTSIEACQDLLCEPRSIPWSKSRLVCNLLSVNGLHLLARAMRKRARMLVDNGLNSSTFADQIMDIFDRILKR